MLLPWPTVPNSFLVGKDRTILRRQRRSIVGVVDHHFHYRKGSHGPMPGGGERPAEHRAEFHGQAMRDAHGMRHRGDTNRWVALYSRTQYPYINRRTIDEGRGNHAPDAGNTPSCIIKPSVSMIMRVSFMRPPSSLSITTPQTRTGFPVAGTPRNGC